MGGAGSVLFDDEAVTTAANASTSGKVNRTGNNAKPGVPEEARPTFEVSLIVWANNSTVQLPEKFLLKISYESLDFVKVDNGEALVQFPFQNIICWGSTSQNFQFRIFDFENPSTDLKNSGILISVRTSQGKQIEECTMANVKKLMLDINNRALSKPEFQVLQTHIFEENGELKADWLTIVDQFTASGRLFLAKQGIELLQKVAPHAPFEKFDLVSLIYDRMISKESVQLLINTFEDEQERDNLILRLKSDKRIKNTVSSKTIMT